MRYTVISSDSREDFEEEVNQCLVEGWELKGDLIVQIVLGDTYPVKYFQVMTISSSLPKGMHSCISKGDR
jgi:Domain of unknown function (DUF1737)